MDKFEYEITIHPADEFSHVVYFCTEQGECSYDEVPTDQLKILSDVLNERGANGWEMAQMLFGKDGILAFWKRKTTP